MSNEDKRDDAEQGANRPEAGQDADTGNRKTDEVEEVFAEPMEDDAAPGARTPARRSAVVGAWIVALLTLAVAGGVTGGGYWIWQQQQATDARQADRLDDLAARIGSLPGGGDIQNLREQLAREIRAAQQTNQDQNRAIQNLEDALGAMHDVAMRDQRGWMVAEIEYLIQVANHRLRLMRDFEGAIAALQAADRRVRELGDPKLLPVREKLADEIQVLKGFERPDLVGIALRLDRMINHLEPMPLQQPAQASTRQDLAVAVSEEQKSVSGFFRHLWNEFQSNIDYREYDEPVKSLPDATSELHMNQLLRLRLEAARIAVLRQDDGEYHRQLQAAQEWLTESFQGEQADTLANELAELDSVNLRPELPRLTDSLDVLQELASRPRPATPAAQEPQAPPAPAESNEVDAS